jgi:hypothetical protein
VLGKKLSDDVSEHVRAPSLGARGQTYTFQVLWRGIRSPRSRLHVVSREMTSRSTTSPAPRLASGDQAAGRDAGRQVTLDRSRTADSRAPATGSAGRRQAVERAREVLRAFSASSRRRRRCRRGVSSTRMTGGAARRRSAAHQPAVGSRSGRRRGTARSATLRAPRTASMGGCTGRSSLPDSQQRGPRLCCRSQDGGASALTSPGESLEPSLSVPSPPVRRLTACQTCLTERAFAHHRTCV